MEGCLVGGLDVGVVPVGLVVDLGEDYGVFLGVV